MRPRFFKLAAIAIVAIPVVGFVVMFLWNSIVPSATGWHPINFWQALGLLILSKILFGGFHSGPGRHIYARRRIMERWAQMTPEEREKFREGIGHCGARATTDPESLRHPA